MCNALSDLGFVVRASMLRDVCLSNVAWHQFVLVIVFGCLLAVDGFRMLRQAVGCLLDLNTIAALVPTKQHIHYVCVYLASLPPHMIRPACQCDLDLPTVQLVETQSYSRGMPASATSASDNALERARLSPVESLSLHLRK